MSHYPKKPSRKGRDNRHLFLQQKNYKKSDLINQIMELARALEKESAKNNPVPELEIPLTIPFAMPADHYRKVELPIL